MVQPIFYGSVVHTCTNVETSNSHTEASFIGIESELEIYSDYEAESSTIRPLTLFALTLASIVAFL